MGSTSGIRTCDLRNFDLEDYALWEVIENGNSWVRIPVTTPETGLSTTMKMTVPSTAEEKTCKKNDVKARSLLFMAFPIREHQNLPIGLNRNHLLLLQQASKLVSRLAILGFEMFCTASTKVNTVSTKISTASFSDATIYAFLSTQPQGSQLVYEDLEQLHDDDLEEMDLKWNMALLSMRARKPNVNTVRARGFNAVKPSACWVWRPIKPNGASLSNSQLNDKGFVDSGCSRHMSGNIAHLSDFKDFDGGYVTFGGGANGGRITGKGTIKTDKLDFEDVYFVKELKFNLFSVSQMCDKKNYVLFTDSECLVLSPNFKLPDENQILLKIPRQNNMYSFDMKNIVPKDGLTCLVAKATSEESMLWHRRLGHVNFKNINKLVKENLDETTEILKNFIKEIENLVDKKVKIIRSDNGTKFKYKMMDDFCREKGIKREYSVARIPQQNGIAERKNRTLIEAARTMVLVVKPHNKTPYELFRGIKPTIGFMKPFGCHVTILNTLDKLGKFDGKSDEGFFVGYSLSSKAFRVYNIRTRKVQENLHVGFLENKPMLEGNGPKWLFDLDSLTQTMNYVPVVAGTLSNDFAGIQGVSESSTSSQQDQDTQDCIVMPIWKDASYFDDASPKSVADAQIQDQNGSHDDCSLQNNSTADQQVNTASPEVNTGSRLVSTAVSEVNTATSEDLVGPSSTFEEEVGDQEIELGNLSPSYAVPTTPHTRVHKDHPIDHVIGDVQSTVQTRRMTTSYSELGFLGAIYEGKTHQDLHTCLFACFLSQEEPKRVSKALSDPAWVEAMQEELLQFKLQKVWVLVDLPKGHRAIGTKWVYRNKKDERGIVIRNKAKTVAQDILKKRALIYDEVNCIQWRDWKAYKIILA
ncbi:retrotransposon protein, putative, ty1-copia subclass [Tanacetum coccineum]